MLLVLGKSFFGGIEIVVMKTEIGRAELGRLVQEAIAIREKAYAPYSHFSVGAAVLDEEGRMFLGVNVENAAYPNGICAETAAIAAMVVGGGRKITAIAVVGGGADLCTPCGGCRQRIREFATEETLLAVAGPEGLREVMMFTELLPKSFGPENLK